MLPALKYRRRFETTGVSFVTPGEPAKFGRAEKNGGSGRERTGGENVGDGHDETDGAELDDQFQSAVG